jgi:hypothetical protein
LRDLDRHFDTAILLVHHSRRSGATRPSGAGHESLEYRENRTIDYREHVQAAAAPLPLRALAALCRDPTFYDDPMDILRNHTVG